MLKLCGAGLIIVASFYGIFLRNRAKRAQKKQLRQWIELLEAMQSEIRWHHVSLIAFLQEQALTSSIFQYLKCKYTLQQFWEAITKEIKDKAVSEALQTLYFSGDQESLLTNIAHVIAQLRDLDRNREEEREKQEKLLNAATFSAAGLLIILLL